MKTDESIKLDEITVDSILSEYQVAIYLEASGENPPLESGMCCSESR